MHKRIWPISNEWFQAKIFTVKFRVLYNSHCSWQSKWVLPNDHYTKCLLQLGKRFIGFTTLATLEVWCVFVFYFWEGDKTAQRVLHVAEFHLSGHVYWPVGVNEFWNVSIQFLFPPMCCSERATGLSFYKIHFPWGPMYN